MALTDFQRAICRLLADQRIASGDLFHDTAEALEASWAADRRLLQEHGFDVLVLRERLGYVEAEVGRGGERVLVEWARDSAYRFFPLVRHPDLGLVLHPFDLATSKVLALVGRLEVRDWVDLIHASERIQPLGYVAWAACGKDPGWSPMGILEEAARTARYSADEVHALAFAGPPPDPADLSHRWRAILAAAREVAGMLPPAEVGRCVLDREGGLWRGGAPELRTALGGGQLHYHAGRIRGALPQIKPLS